MRLANRSRVLLVALTTGLAASQLAEAQAVVFKVRVTTQTGASIPAATVYINDLAISAPTGDNGIATLTLPDSQVSRHMGQSVNLRVRALGYEPQVQVVRIAAGAREVDFKLVRDVSRRDEVPVPTVDAAERARAPLTNAPGQDLSSVAAQADPFGRFMFSPELVMQNQNAIALQESQRATLQTAIQDAQAQVIRMQWALALETEKLTKALNSTTVDEKEVLAQVDRILMTEREIKRAQMTLMIRIKNALTPTQQARLRQLRQSRD